VTKKGKAMTMKQGIPGLQRVDHCALTVPDLDAAVAFYCNVIGGVELYRLGPFDAREIPKMPDGRDWMAAHVNVPDGRVTLCMLQIGQSLMLELFQYDRPTGSKEAVRNWDLGGHHIAFKVDDIAAATEYLRSKDLRVMAGPMNIDQGPAAGLKVNYFLDPWGNQLELVEYGELPFMKSVSGFVRPR